jgi:hypothetical protein
MITGYFGATKRESISAFKDRTFATNSVMATRAKRKGPAERSKTTWQKCKAETPHSQGLGDGGVCGMGFQFWAFPVLRRSSIDVLLSQIGQVLLSTRSAPPRVAPRRGRAVHVIRTRISLFIMTRASEFMTSGTFTPIYELSDELGDRR